MPRLMAPLSVTSAIAAGAANALATATAIRLFFMRSPFLIGLSRSGALTRPPLRRRVSRAVDLTSPGKERSCRDSAKTQHGGASDFSRRHAAFRLFCCTFTTSHCTKKPILAEKTLTETEQDVMGDN